MNTSYPSYPSDTLHKNFVRAFGDFDIDWGYTHQASFSPDGKFILVAMNLWCGTGKARQERQAYGIGSNPAEAVDDCLRQIWQLRPLKVVTLPAARQSVAVVTVSPQEPAADDDRSPLAINKPRRSSGVVAEFKAHHEPAARTAPTANRPTVDQAIEEINRLTDEGRLKQARIKTHALFPDPKQSSKVLEAIDARLSSLASSTA